MWVPYVLDLTTFVEIYFEAQSSVTLRRKIVKEDVTDERGTTSDSIDEFKYDEEELCVFK